LHTGPGPDPGVVTDEHGLPSAPDLLRDLPRQVVPVDALVDTLSPRDRLEDADHVRLLAEAETTHPLLIHRPTMRVIDGVHRLRAAVLNGRTEVVVQVFDGTEADAFVLAVELNVRHGLPLTLAERKAAAQRIIASHANWSDRVIAERTGLSAKTVGRLRGRSAEEDAHGVRRLGRDGKARPVNSTEGRRNAAALMAADPEISLRQLSKRTGVSVGTIRDVRRRLDRGQDPVPDRVRGAAGLAPPERDRGQTRMSCPRDAASMVQDLLRDPSLRATESGRRLLRLLLATEVERSDLAEIAESVPAHCLPLIRAVALRRAEEWKQFAGLVARAGEPPLTGVS
jgi:ParB-like chromosome segregation protein Spo0J